MTESTSEDELLDTQEEKEQATAEDAQSACVLTLVEEDCGLLLVEEDQQHAEAISDDNGSWDLNQDTVHDEEHAHYDEANNDSQQRQPRVTSAVSRPRNRGKLTHTLLNMIFRSRFVRFRLDWMLS